MHKNYIQASGHFSHYNIRHSGGFKTVKLLSTTKKTNPRISENPK